MSAIAILGELRRDGVRVRLVGDNLRLRPSPGKRLAPDLVERVKAAKPELVAYLSASPSAPVEADAYEERAGIIEHDAGLPREIAEGLACLDTMPAPANFSPRHWRTIVDGAARFADRWGAMALALGWTPLELFGLNPEAPRARLDGRGLAFLLADGDVIAMDDRQAVIRMRQGGEQRFRRWKGERDSQLAWRDAL